MRSHIRPISLLFATLCLSLIFTNPAWAFEGTNACKQTHLATASFRVEGRAREALELPGDEAETPALLRRIAGAVLDFLVPSARAATEGASNNFFGTGAGANNSGVENSFFGGNAGLSNTTGNFNAFFGTSAGAANTTGFNNAFFGRTAGVSNTVEDDNAFIGAFSNGAAGITNATAIGFSAQVEQSNAMVLGSIPGVNGGTDYVDVGIGTTMPQAPLHVERVDGTARVRVTELQAGPSMPFQGEAMGLVRFELNDEASGERWRFTNAGDRFAINNVGVDSPGTEMSVFKNGDMTIGGVLTENSDVNAKRDFAQLDAQDVLAKIADLEVVEWSYIDAPKQRHIGPMAQDFRAAFGLGRDNTHIATLDTSGVALLGIQALVEENHRMAQESHRMTEESNRIAEANHRMAEENQDLRQRLELLENIVSGVIEQQQRVAATDAVMN